MAILSLIATICTFSFQTVLTHILTPLDYGILAKWLTDIGYLGMFFVLGLDASLLYYAKLGESFENNMGKNLIIYFFVFLLAFFIIYILELNISYYLPLSISIICFAISGVFKSYFHFKEQYLWFNLLNLVLPFSLLIVFGITFLLGIKINIDKTLILYTFISLFVLIIVAIKYFTVASISFAKDTFSNLTYFIYGIKSILLKVLSLTLYASTIYIISYYRDFELVAFFFVASSISKMVWVLPDSAGNVLYPRFLKIGTKYNREDLIKEMNYYAQIVFLLNIIIVIGFVLIGHFILDVLFSIEYQSLFIPIIILLIGNQGMVYFKLLSRYLAAENNWKPLYYSLTIGVFVNVILNFILIPYYGLNGACIATSLSFISCGIFISFFVKGTLLEFINIFNIYKIYFSK